MELEFSLIILSNITPRFAIVEDPDLNYFLSVNNINL
jgi:hypothetical protein